MTSCFFGKNGPLILDLLSSQVVTPVRGGTSLQKPRDGDNAQMACEHQHWVTSEKG